LPLILFLILFIFLCFVLWEMTPEKNNSHRG
jgi:hypothetical protein